MDVESLSLMPEWQWPPGAGEVLLRALRAPDADPSKRVLAAELAGSIVVMNDDLAGALLSLVAHPGAAEELRSTAALALGPILEELDIGFYDDELEEAPVSDGTEGMIRSTLQRVHADGDVPKHVRRRALEASIRAPEDWHAEAVREAYDSGDRDWRITAVFCMGHLPGFEAEILEALESGEPPLRFEAVRAAGQRGLADAWPLLRALLRDPRTDRELRLAAIEAVAGVRPEEADDVLFPFLESDDEELVEAAREAMSMAQVFREDVDFDPDLESVDDSNDHDRPFHMGPHANGRGGG